MITADLHTHTLYSHGKDTPLAMWTAAQQKNISLYGFTEHSPRPNAYTYTNEYRDRLMAYFPQYVAEVQALKQQYPGQVLLGIEMDWFEKDQDFIRDAIAAHPYDYIIGSVHFLERWGYDDDPADWKSLYKNQCDAHYEAYFCTLKRMAQSGLFHIAAHIDLIKIFSLDPFNTWLAKASAQKCVGEALEAIKQAGMAMELSSAGLRKMCAEIYPGSVIMTLAADMNIPIAIGSDAHNVDDIASHFDILEAYARRYAYTHSVWFCNGVMHERGF